MKTEGEPLCPKAMTVSFSNEDDRWIRAKSKATSKSKAEIIREAIGEYRASIKEGNICKKV